MLRAVQGHGAPKPILQRVQVTGSYVQRMPSFPSTVKKTQFLSRLLNFKTAFLY